MASGISTTKGSHASEEVSLASGLDLSFGYTPMQFEKINLLGSELSEHAISSLVLSVPNITYLDLRGNKLDAAFGWRLVKAMKKGYLNLEYCNGVPLRALRTNSIDSLNLASFGGHHGMYGIEVVGAIFLAHFLRLNSSLTYLNFRRNDVQKDGAKALAQSLLGNPQCVLRTVNTMGPSKSPARAGIDFGLFRTGQLTTVHLPKRLIDDDDFVFLEEWLRRYDCVTDLDISDNLLCRDGVRKLARYIKDTKSLLKLNCVGLPVDLEGSSQIARAVVENETLTAAAIPLGPCDDNPERQQMLQQLGIGLSQHQTLQSFASGRATNLEWANLLDVRDHRVRAFPPERSSGWPKPQMAVYMWFAAAVKAPLERLSFGPAGNPSKEYPTCLQSPAELWPSLVGLTHDMGRSLLHVSVAVPRGYGPRAMELMKVLTRCNVLKTLQLLGYGSAVFKDSQLPSEWSGIGSAPRWLVDERVRKCKVHWQALFGLLSSLPHLEQFNEIALEGNLRDQPELTCLLLLQCLEGVAARFEPGPMGNTVLVARLQKEADVDAFCDVLRVLSRTPMLVEITFSDKSAEVVKAQQLRLQAPLSGLPAGENGPRFTHAVVLKNSQVSETLLKTIDCNAPLREFGYENIDTTLEALFAALCGREKPLPVERIRVEPKWVTQCLARKRFSERQRRMLDGVQAALIRSDRFVEVHTSARGAVSRSEIEGMSPQEFAELMTGIGIEDPPQVTRHGPQTPWRCFPTVRQFLNPDSEAEPLFIPLPLDDETKDQLQLRKLSLCMCNLRTRLTQVARADEWPDPSRPLWHGIRRFMRPGDWAEADAPAQEDDLEEEEEDDSRAVRFHWREHLRIGTRQARSLIAQVMDPQEPPFADTLLHESLRSLLSEGSTLTSLDLRGNGLTREDANLVLSLLEKHETLISLNQIPVTVDEAQACAELVFDSTGIQKVAPQRDQDDSYNQYDDEPEGGEAFAREALEADFARIDEGDGFVFLSLVTPQYFPELRSVVLRRLQIPLDMTLAHITDALLNLPNVEQLQLSDLRLSSRGASLLLQAVAEMAPRLVNLNGLPLGRLVQLREAGEGGTLELPSGIEWNDFPLGAMARLNLWQVACFPPTPGDGSGAEFRLQGKTLTDVGLRGLCVMLRHFAGLERAPSTRGMSSLHLLRIDLSGNSQITDATVADLCHTLQHPSLGASLRHSLRELSVRSCARLHTRSAFELLNFVQHVREVAQGRDGPTSAPLGTSLQMINGIDLEVLQLSARASGAAGRAAGPPMLLRTFVEPEGGLRQGNPRPEFSALSECDVHFFASMLHMFPHIPYCHVHVVLPHEFEEEENVSEGLSAWGRADGHQEEAPLFVVSAAAPPSVSNDSPFPPPHSSQKRVTDAVQAHLDAARRFFEACPISTQLRLSVAPCVPGCEDLLAAGDHAVLGAVPGAERPPHLAVSVFGRIKGRLQEKAAKRRRSKLGPASGGASPADATPARPLYVNNINSQRLHCCFRTLYGKDDMELEHNDIISDQKTNIRLPAEVDVSKAFGVATSVDLQHLDLGPSHLISLANISEMPVLTHVNLNHNHLGDAGVELLFKAMVDAGCSVVHVSVASNNIGDEGASIIAASLGNLPRLTSLELCDNFIQERGSLALAEAVGGVAAPEDAEGEEAVPVGPLPLLSVDLRGNRSRELGARRWAEVICSHPDLKFLCLAQNEVGCLTKEYFLDLVCAAVASTALSVLDLQENFPQPASGPGRAPMGPPPAEVIEELLAELPSGEFDPAEVRRGVFIRRHRGGGDAAKKETARAG